MGWEQCPGWGTDQEFGGRSTVPASLKGPGQGDTGSVPAVAQWGGGQNQMEEWCTERGDQPVWWVTSMALKRGQGWKEGQSEAESREATTGSPQRGPSSIWHTLQGAHPHKAT